MKAVLSLGFAVSLVCCLCVTSVAGKTTGNGGEPPATSAPPPKDEAKPHQKLRADISRLTPDAKAGKITPRRPVAIPAESPE